MKNLQIDRFKLHQDVEMAEKIAKGQVSLEKKMFHTYSMIYRTTNENISHDPYVEALQHNGRVLSITASGDQIINSILYGGQDITGVDISVFPKYFVALKLAALQTLDKDEYLLYILGNDTSTPPLSIDLYNKVRENLDSYAKRFWDKIFNSNSPKELSSSPLFSYFSPSFKTMIANNPYLQDKNYNLVRTRLENAKVLLYDFNLFNIEKSDFGDFDLILLSNVLNYMSNNGKWVDDSVKCYRDCFNRLPLRENGIAVAYNFIFNGGLYKKLNGGKFKVYRVKEDVKTADIKNEIIVYQNQRKRLSLFGRK